MSQLRRTNLRARRAGAAPRHRIEQVVAIVGTALVLGLYLATSGASLLEGVVAYALLGWCCTFSPSALF
jgi:hypothetical protein